MRDDPAGGQRWYVRRKGQTRGPYDAACFERYVLLGRIRSGDEISRDGRQWEPFHEQHPLYPMLLREADTPEGLERLIAVRERLDERRGQRRIVTGGMHANKDPAPKPADRRQGEDPFLEALRQRVLAGKAASPAKERRAFWKRMLLWSPFVVMLFSIVYVSSQS